jgi:hypothetical protein
MTARPAGPCRPRSGLDGLQVDRRADVERGGDLDHADEAELLVDLDDRPLRGEREHHVDVALTALVERRRLPMVERPHHRDRLVEHVLDREGRDPVGEDATPLERVPGLGRAARPRGESSARTAVRSRGAPPMKVCRTRRQAWTRAVSAM